ncbi:hypothetical protein C8J57DRAFT_1277821 [Mycena rebaudengoi]|nr:hypothetical protein C8J57DRAFT_1277821 [Mycena rebaudengoi]
MRCTSAPTSASLAVPTSEILCRRQYTHAAIGGRSWPFRATPAPQVIDYLALARLPMHHHRLVVLATPTSCLSIRISPYPYSRVLLDAVFPLYDPALSCVVTVTQRHSLTHALLPVRSRTRRTCAGRPPSSSYLRPFSPPHPRAHSLASRHMRLPLSC